tara:strand:+ start:131 stop:598 length:468 start_codon:yes stop_codon:yes gene_type:complete
MNDDNKDKYLPVNSYSKRELTEMQIALLDYLPECDYNPNKAATKAGYANTTLAIRSVREEITSIAEDLIANSTLKAANTLDTIMTSDRPMLNIKEKMEAAKTLLDRGGFAKKEIIDVSHKVIGGVFVLPEKKPIKTFNEHGEIDGDYEDIPSDKS